MINRFATLISRFSLAFAVLFTIAACGGGGGGGFIPDNDSDTDDPLTIVTTALPEAIDGLEYTALVEASGGKEPYSWVILDDGGTGFTINNEGLITGIAPQSGNYGLTLQVTDNAGKTDKVSIIVTVTGGDTGQPLAIATTSLPNAQEREEYSTVLEAVGGQGAYQWTLIDNGGSGLDLRPDGLLSGTAPGKGDYPITVAVQDDTREVSSILILTVTAPSDPLNITTSSLPGGTVGERYAAALQAGGGNPPYTWMLISDGGSGLSLSSAGILSGTPALGGTFGLVFMVRDGTSTDQSAATVAISTGSDPEIGQLRIVTDSLPDADRVLYAAAVEAQGGVKDYTWRRVDGNPPTGFVINSTSGAITGNTNDLLPGQYGFSVTVVDSAGAEDTRSYVIEVPGGDLPPVRIETPNPLPDATENLTYSVVMRAVGGGADKTWRVVETIKDDGSLFLNGPDFPGANADSGVLFWSAGDIEVGNYLVTIEVVSNDADKSADVVTFNLKAIVAPIKITTTTLPNASVGSDYLTQLTFTGGGATRSWSVVETTKDGAVVANGPIFAAPGSAADGQMFWSSAGIAEGMYRVTISVTSTNAGVTTEDTVALDLQADP